MDDDDQPKESRETRLAIGLLLGVSVGVVLFLLLDNVALIAVGIAIGVLLGAMPTATAPDDERGAGPNGTPTP